MPSAEQILHGFKEFATAPSAQAVALVLAEKRTADAAAWGDDDDIRNLAVALRAAHWMKLAGHGSGGAVGAGPVSSESIGSLSVSYAVSSAEGSDLSTTTYGKQLEQLIAENFIGAMTSYDR